MNVYSTHFIAIVHHLQVWNPKDIHSVVMIKTTSMSTFLK